MGTYLKASTVWKASLQVFSRTSMGRFGNNVKVTRIKWMICDESFRPASRRFSSRACLREVRGAPYSIASLCSEWLWAPMVSVSVSMKLKMLIWAVGLSHHANHCILGREIQHLVSSAGVIEKPKEVNHWPSRCSWKDRHSLGSSTHQACREMSMLQMRRFQKAASQLLTKFLISIPLFSPRELRSRNDSVRTVREWCCQLLEGVLFWLLEKVAKCVSRSTRSTERQ